MTPSNHNQNRKNKDSTMKYYTIENKLTNDGSYNARVMVDRTYTEDELIDRMLQKRNIVSKPDLRGVISALKETLAEIVEEGNNLNLSWFKLGYSMKGRFDAEETVRDPDRNPLEIILNAGEFLTERLEKVRLERILPPNYTPRIVSFTDAVSGTTKSEATPGGTFKVTGDRLRIGGHRPEEIGLYLRAEDDTETKVEVLMDNETKVINGQLPDTLATGDYKLVVKTQLSVSNHTLSEVRTGTSSFTVTVK